MEASAGGGTGTPDDATATLSCYHSFPRRGVDDVGRGLRVLRSILCSGILLTPEVNEFRGEPDEVTRVIGSPLLVVQQRFCLTCLHRSELSDHAQLFGMFHLRFDFDAIRRLGAVPVIYVPQPSPTVGASNLPMVGTAIVHRLKEAQDLLHDLNTLQQEARRGPFVRVSRVNAGTHRDLRSSDVQWLVESLLPTRPVIQLEAAVRTFASMFQSIARTRHAIDHQATATTSRRDDYYRQREWRLLGGITDLGVPLDRPLLPREASAIVATDPDFFEATRDYPNGRTSVVEQCRLISAVAGAPVHHSISELIVPRSAVPVVRQLVERELGASADLCRRISAL
jgi:hypothetical protein